MNCEVGRHIGGGYVVRHLEMNWDAVVAVAEILGAVAVVVTLLFLLKQIKTNSVMIQNSIAQASADHIANWSRQLTGNPELHRIYRTGLKGDTLSNEDRGLFDLVLFQAFNSIHSIYFQYRNGGIKKDRWESEMRMFAPILKSPGGRASWDRQKYMLDVDFQKELEAIFA